jgi:hypothetical protein
MSEALSLAESPVGGGAYSLEHRIKSHATSLGFDPVGITRLGAADTHPAFLDWLARGYAGEMGYLHRGAEKRRDTGLPFPGVSSAIVVALDYGGKQPPGTIARYARGLDYHDVMLRRLEALHRFVETAVERPVRGKAYVDTGPLLERDLARQAGLGWIGKNTMLLNPRRSTSSSSRMRPSMRTDVGAALGVSTPVRRRPSSHRACSTPGAASRTSPSSIDPTSPRSCGR